MVNNEYKSMQLKPNLAVRPAYKVINKFEEIVYLLRNQSYGLDHKYILYVAP